MTGTPSPANALAVTSAIHDYCHCIDDEEFDRLGDLMADCALYVDGRALALSDGPAVAARFAAAATHTGSMATRRPFAMNAGDTAAQSVSTNLPGANRALGILLTFLAISFIDRQVLSLLVDDIRRALVISDVQIGLLQGFAFSLVYAIAGLPIGWAVDRYSRRLVILTGMSIWSLGTLACGLADDFTALFVARVLVGAGEAALAPAAFSLMADLFARDRLASAIGTYYVGSNIGAGIAFLAGGALITAFHAIGPTDWPLLGTLAPWQAVFVIVGLPGAILAWAVFAIDEPPRRRMAAADADAARIGDLFAFMRRERRLLFCHFAGFTAVGMAVYSIGAWAAAYFTRNFQLAPSVVGMALFLAFGIGASAGNVIAGRVVDARFRAGDLAAFYRVHFVTTLIGAPIVILAFTVPNFWIATLALSVGVGTLTSFGGSSSACLQLIAPPRLRGKVSVAYLFILTGIGSGLGPLLVALMVDHVFRHPTSVGRAIVALLVACAPTGAALLYTGMKPLRMALAQDRDRR